MVDAKVCYSDSQVRDYIHVVDLADGHIAALEKLDDAKIGMPVFHRTI